MLCSLISSSLLLLTQLFTGSWTLGRFQPVVLVISLHFDDQISTQEPASCRILPQKTITGLPPRGLFLQKPREEKAAVLFFNNRPNTRIHCHKPGYPFKVDLDLKKGKSFGKDLPTPPPSKVTSPDMNSELFDNCQHHQGLL